MTGLALVAAWSAPALAVGLAARVARGDADAPLLVLASVVAPLVALLLSTRAEPRARPLGATVALAWVALVTVASLSAAGDVAGALGAAPWQGVVVAGALAALPALLPGARWSLLLPLGLLALAGGALVVGGAVSTPSWRAWADTSARPAFRFAAHGGWVNAGGRVERPTTLEFEEGQRVTALAAGVFRVVEREQAKTTTREWRLAAGDALTLRPGDRLTLEAGARVRFEAGARVPGAPASGAVWADAPERHHPRRLVAWLGAFVTLVGGAAVLRHGWAPARAHALSAVASALVLPLAAAAWGVYAAAAPELLLGGADAAVFAALPREVLGAGSGAGAVVAALACAGLVALLLAAAHALLTVLAEPLGARHPAAWLGVVVVAAAGALWPGDPWRALMLGWGLAASAWAAPALGARDAPSVTAGAWAGVLVWAGLVALDLLRALPPSAVELGQTPALAAAPAAWLVARGAGAWRVGKDGRR